MSRQQSTGFFQYHPLPDREVTQIIGNDISHFQGVMNFATAFSAGSRFIIHRVGFLSTVGVLTQDTEWNSTRASAIRSAGLKLGAYWAHNPNNNGGANNTTTDAVNEATQFYNWLVAASPSLTDMYVILDFEDPAGTVSTSVTNDQAYDFIEAFINQYNTLSGGRACGIYTFYATIDGLTAGTGDELVHSTKGPVSNIGPAWLAASAPDLPNPPPATTYPNYNFTNWGGYTDWEIWQYSTDNPPQGRGAEFGASSTEIDINILESDFFSVMPPNQVTGLNAAEGNQQVLLSWNLLPDTDIVNYKVYQNDSLIATLGPSTTMHLVSGLTNGVTYKFDVSAIDTWEEGPKSAPVLATPDAGVVGPVAGKKAKIMAYGSSLPFTDEATTTSDNQTYQITDTTKRVWCRNCTITVKDGGSPTTESFIVDRLTGRVIFSTAAVRTITITGEYLPIHTVAEAFEYTYTLSADNVDSTVFGEEFMNRTQALKDFSASISQFYGDDYFNDKWIADGQYVLEFFIDGTSTPTVRAWTKISSDESSAAVDALVEESIDFEGTTDADGRTVSFGPF